MYHYATDANGVIVCAMQNKKPTGTFPSDWTWLTTEEEIERCHEGKLWFASEKPVAPVVTPVQEAPIAHILYGTAAAPATLPENTIYCQY